MFVVRQLITALQKVELISDIYYYATIGSTNAQGHLVAEQGAPSGTLLVADEQTAGRGRAGRSWVTLAGRSIASTMLLRDIKLPFNSRIALLGGLAVNNAIEAQTGLKTAIKWPNDIWVNNRKLAGILAEMSYQGTSVNYALLGVGLNVNGQPPNGEGWVYPPTTLEAELNQPIDRLSLLVAIWLAVDEWLPQLNTPAFLNAVTERLLWRDQWVQIESANETITGRLVGLGEDGALLLADEKGRMRRFVAIGDISLRGDTAA